MSTDTLLAIVLLIAIAFISAATTLREPPKK